MIERDVYLTQLYDCYFKLLTEKQRLYFEDYYFNNLTLSEMSEAYNISRNAVHKQLKDVNDKLMDFENKLKVYEKNKKLEEISHLMDENLRKRINEIIND